MDHPLGSGTARISGAKGMANHRKTHLDAVESRLTGPKRIALFGHRNVGKTTLLAIFYRQASSGFVPGVRLAAADPATAEYLADKIIQIESGESLAGTLAETELRLRLYHGQARFDLIVKDYQGEHVTLGSDEPIQQFFADCDAVFLCLDPEGSSQPADRRRRQKEVENLLEKYIDKSADGMTDRPIALLLTKFDRVMAQSGGSLENVEKLVDARYGMTRHALSRHAKRGAIFAVSAYGRGAIDGRPPVELHPIGLEGPLAWLAEQLEAIDRDALEWLWDLAPNDIPRLARGVAAYERRYPNTERAIEFRKRLSGAKRRRARRVLVKATLGLGLIAGALAGLRRLGLPGGDRVRAGSRPGRGRAPLVGPARLAPDPAALLAGAGRVRAEPALGMAAQGGWGSDRRRHVRPRPPRPARDHEGRAAQARRRDREGRGQGRAGAAGEAVGRSSRPRRPRRPTGPSG